MGIRLSDWLYKWTNGRAALITLLIFLLFTALVLPDQASKAAVYLEGVGSPDTSFFYAAEDLYRFAEAYGPAGRAAYVRARFTFDVVWPLVYTFFLITAITWVYARVFPPASGWRLANLAPVYGMGFDFLENLSASLVMVRYPAKTGVVDMLAPFFTLVKWVFVNGSFGLLLLGLVVWLWRRVRSRRM
jgi:hypothetical protein